MFRKNVFFSKLLASSYSIFPGTFPFQGVFLYCVKLKPNQSISSSVILQDFNVKRTFRTSQTLSSQICDCLLILSQQLGYLQWRHSYWNFHPAKSQNLLILDISDFRFSKANSENLECTRLNGQFPSSSTIVAGNWISLSSSMFFQLVQHPLHVTLFQLIFDHSL